MNTKLIPKYLTGKKFLWQRVKLGNNYKYVKIDNQGHPVEKNPDNPMGFRMYDEPNELSNWSYGVQGKEPERPKQESTEKPSIYLLIIDANGGLPRANKYTFSTPWESAKAGVDFMLPGPAFKIAAGTLGAVAGLPALQWAGRVLTPGSLFWMHPATKVVLGGAAGGAGVDAASQFVTGNTWSGNVGNSVEQLTGWNPNSTWWGQALTGATNPGYYMSGPVSTTVGKAGNFLERNLGFKNGWVRVGNTEYSPDPNSLNSIFGSWRSRKVGPTVSGQPVLKVQISENQSIQARNPRRMVINAKIGDKELTVDELGKALLQDALEVVDSKTGKIIGYEVDRDPETQEYILYLLNKEYMPGVLKTRNVEAGDVPYTYEQLVDENGNLRDVALYFDETIPGVSGAANQFDELDNALTRATKYFNTKKGSVADVRKVMNDNPVNRSGVKIKYMNGDWSIDSFGLFLKGLRKNFAKGRKFLDLKPKQTHVTANDWGLLSRYTEEFDPEFAELIKQNNGNIPNGITVGLNRNTGVVSFQDANTKLIVGKLIPRSKQSIIDEINPKILEMNNTFGLNIPEARISKDTNEIEWPNIYGILYKKGGRLNEKDKKINISII